MNEQAPKLPDLELIKVIGTGSYGEVWLAKTVTGLYRAVKVVDRARFSDERPWLREFAGISRYQKDMGGRPRQLALLHVGEDRQQGIFYYVMELADDLDKGPDIDPAAYEPCTLKSLRKKHPNMALEEVLRIGIDLTRSLAELHEAGLIHRDVKPSNVVFVHQTPKLADLGLVSSSDHTLTSLGTPGYSPPEVVATPRSDIFSLGRILYELAMQLPSAEFPRLPPDLPSRPGAERLMELNEILLTACNPDPQQRYKDANALLADLLHVQAGGSLVEVARLRERLARAASFAKWAGVIVLATSLVFGARHYQALRRLAAEEASGRALAEKEERQARYVADLQLAQVGIQASDYGIAVSALQRQIPPPGTPDLRGAEWWTLRNQLRGDLTPLVDLGRPLSSAVPSADGSALLCLAPEGERKAAIINLSGRSVAGLLGERLQALGAESHDGCFIANTWDNQVLDLPSNGAPARTWQGLQGAVRASNADFALIFSNLSTTKWELILVDRNKHRELLRWSPPDATPGTNFRYLALSPDGRRLAINLLPKSETFAWRSSLVDLQTGRELWGFTEETIVGHSEFSPDGKLLALAGNGQFRIIDAASGELRWSCNDQPGRLDALSWSPDGRFLAVGDAKARVAVYDVANHTQNHLLRGAKSGILQLSWERNNRALTITESNGNISRCSLEEPQPSDLLRGFASELSNNYAYLVFDRQPGRILETLTDNTLGLVQMHPQKLLQRWPDALMPLANRQEGGWFALGQKGRLIICNPDGTSKDTDIALPSKVHLIDMSVSSDGRYCAFALDRLPGTLILWDLQERKAAEYTTTNTTLRAVHFDCNNRWVAVSDNKNGLCFLNLATRTWGDWFGRKGMRASSLASTADGKRAFVGYADGQIQELNLETMSLGRSETAHHGTVSGLMLLDNDHTLLSISRDGTYAFHRTEGLRHLLTALAKSNYADHSPTGLCSLHGQPDRRLLAIKGNDDSIQFLQPAGP